MITLVALTATLTAGTGPGPGLNDAVRMASTVQWNAVTHWNATQEWNQVLAVGRTHVRPSALPTASTKLDRIRACESGGDYTAVSADGRYRGAYQFTRGTWASVGGTGDPAGASPAEQDTRAQILYDQAGTTPWPNCGR